MVSLLVLAAMLAACDTQITPSPLRPTSGPEGQPTPGTATEVETLPCAEAEVATAEPQPYLAQAPEQPEIPGAVEIDDLELNEGQELTTPIDPDAVVDANADLTPTVIPPAGAQGDELPTDIVTFRQTTTIPGTSQIAEPNIAVHGITALMTWNKGVARSFDGGATPRYLNPWNHMLGPDGNVVDGGFCCDQLAQYVPGHDLWVWVLQSLTRLEGHRGGNRIRIYLATGDESFDRYRDFRAQDLGLGADIWFDQPKIGTTNGHLFLSVNAYGPNPDDANEGPPFVTSVVMRLSLDDLATEVAAAPTCFTTTNQPNSWGYPTFGPAPVARAEETMYLGAHFSTSALAVWRWPDDSARPTRHLVLDTGGDGEPLSYPIPLKRDQLGGYVRDADGHFIADKYRCPSTSAPDAQNWCERSGDRIGSAWIANGQVGFSWNVGQDPVNGWNYPSVWVQILDETRITNCELGGCIVAKPHLRFANHAYQYAAIGPNSRGDLGVVVLYGGGAYRLSCAVGALRDPTAEGPWDFIEEGLVASDRDPVYPTAGDYLNIWPGPTEGSWMSGCMTVQSTNGTDRPGSVHFAWFGRRSDTPAQ